MTALDWSSLHWLTNSYRSERINQPSPYYNVLVFMCIQILSGIYPIAQVREPYTVVGYLARRLPLVQLLRLQHPSGIATVAKRTAGRRVGDFELDDPNIAHLIAFRDSEEESEGVFSGQGEEWTAWDICDGGYVPMIRGVMTSF